MALEDYNWADRMVHRIAFRARAPQHILMDMEDRRFGDRLASQRMGAPIFVTALPRAGTTLMLEVLSCHPDTATHTYRDMPFVLSPVIWQQLSGKFQVRQDAKERSHGDGMLVSADSPEAFEEVLWQHGYPQDFHSDCIRLRERLDPKFLSSLQRHMRAICVARGMSNATATRYVSKNNANIARLDALAQAFPDASLIIPLRHPIDQARSLLRQHQKALTSHSHSRFARDYVRDIGHFEFGAEHRPIWFEGMSEVVARLQPDSLDYWIAYWIAAARHIKRLGIGKIVDMTRFTHGNAVTQLYEALGLEQSQEALARAQDLVRPIKSYDEEYVGPLASEAMDLYEDLRQPSACLI
ncbi:sulfotransferase [Altererythrobacter sp.]|uniref:sulfotransferase n=3 Tax=Altererythrobacter sp. TaxID=1872480 RepID=UPI003D107522